MSSSDEHFKAAVDLSRDALKSLILVNGGAATAFIALMDKSGAAHNYIAAVIDFAYGTVSAVVASSLGYFSQLSYANHRLWIEKGIYAKADRHHLWHRLWQAAALLAFLTALTFTVLGVFAAARVAGS